MSVKIIKNSTLNSHLCHKERKRVICDFAVKRLTEVGFYFLGGSARLCPQGPKELSQLRFKIFDAYGKSMTFLIGPRSVLSLSQASGIALELLKAKILAGRDPLEEKKQARQKNQRREKTATNPKLRKKVANDWLKDRVARNGFFRNNPGR